LLCLLSILIVAAPCGLYKDDESVMTRSTFLTKVLKFSDLPLSVYGEGD